MNKYEKNIGKLAQFNADEKLRILILNVSEIGRKDYYYDVLCLYADDIKMFAGLKRGDIMLGWMPCRNMNELTEPWRILP